MSLVLPGASIFLRKFKTWDSIVLEKGSAFMSQTFSNIKALDNTLLILFKKY
jgi:hypothetical protein